SVTVIRPNAQSVHPTGTVHFKNAGVTVCSVTLTAAMNGVASCTAAPKQVVGTHQFDAEYVGDINYSAGAPATALTGFSIIKVNPASISPVTSTVATGAVYGTTVPVRVTITPVTGGVHATGLVT